MKMAYKKKRKDAEETGEEEFLAKVGKNVLFSEFSGRAYGISFATALIVELLGS
jgi:hypothetical protein